MLPSILSTEILEGLKSFVTTGFETNTPLFSGMFTRLVEKPGQFYKGPYLSLDLPFQQGGDDIGTGYFPTFKTEYPPYKHQQQAWERLTSNKTAAATLIATGTGSGKTECFLYPVLDHCIRHPGNGIKAIFIYPMNALATDQARRMAKLIHKTPSLKTLRVGLFVGEEEAETAKTMQPDKVISDKNVLRDHPPDILLTNYKMLDFLLMRPRDRKIWKANQPDTLRYLVVDELHTFDGAQGTDLACLIRRLKSRLECEEGHLICAGTSATLGSEDSVGELTNYASQVFQTDFGKGSVIGESRQDVSSFMGQNMLKYYLSVPDNMAEVLLPERYDTMGAYIFAQYTLLFGQEPEKEVTDAAWRSELGGQLKEHPVFYNFLQLLTGQPLAIAALAEKMQRVLPPMLSRHHVLQLLNSLCALIAWARDPENPKLPLAMLRMQLWIRELRRMVAPLRLPKNQQGEAGLLPITFADDVKQEHHGIHLPLVQCTQCHATAWTAVKPKTQGQLKTDLRLIYNAFFGNQPELVTLFPIDENYTPPPHVLGQKRQLCSGCGTLQGAGEACISCGETEFRQVFVPENLKEVTHKSSGISRVITEHHCPMCSGKHTLMVFGSRAASLSSVAIFHSYATPYNDDRKLITFSDSVQDAAHRAGFFAARTWQSNIRMAMTQAVPDDNICLTDFYQHLPRYWRDEKGMEPVRYISEFIAPNMLWFENYRALIQDEVLGEEKQQSLLGDIDRRLEWEVLAEFGYRSRIGRTLPRTGTIAVGIEQDVITDCSTKLLLQWQEELGLREISLQQVQHFILGFLWYLKGRGAIYHPMLERYIYQYEGGNFFFKNQYGLPDFAPQTPAPVFICNRNSHKYFDCLIHKQGKSWYQSWCLKVLADEGNPLALANRADEAIYQSLLPVLVKQGLLLPFEFRQFTAWGLNPDKLYLSKQVVGVSTQQQSVYIPEDMLEAFVGMPSMINDDRGEYQLKAEKTHWLTRLYRKNEIHRVFAGEHTGLLERDKRQQVEDDFMAGDNPWSLNLLSATPTLEMGIDIGDLSSVLLCSVPPAQANYLQRVGRAGRRDGNAFSMTVAEGAPHDLYFYSEPREMLAGKVESPGVFLNAPAVISRQLTAFCFDCWVASGIDENAIPDKMRSVLNAAQRNDGQYFPHNFLDFVRSHAPGLLEAFLRLFNQDKLALATLEYLTGFLLGNDGQEALDHRVVRHIHGVLQELSELTRQRDKLKNRLKRLKGLPQDEATAEEILAVETEQDGLNKIINHIKGQQVLNFFTDEGLLPNYAFPESGVTLRSVIYRRSQSTDKTVRKFENKVYEYERSGASALSELAPENLFYAGGRKVSISQVDMKLSKPEVWRFCPSCAYAEAEKAEVEHACPRCKEPMWSDSGQQMTLLRLRQVMANTSDKESRISDDSEKREPLFYNKQMLADFDPAVVESSWKLDSDSLPFGFEFIPKTTFREINFGQQGGSELELTVAGETLVRPGFRLCKHCGTVQTDEAKGFEHTYSCPRKDKASEADIKDCLYLYREFTSESLRILLPVSVTEEADRYLNSFIAALQLGLRRKFGGKVDHLRVMNYSAPIAETDNRKQFLMLYDSVPGGTGYLKTLLDDPQELMQVFQEAHDAMAGCACNQQVDQDGCYRCLYAYRNSHGMETTSRTLAVNLLSRILDLRDKLVQINSINDIPVNPTFDSELEARFIEAIRHFVLKYHASWDMQIQPQVVNGKPGYYLRIGVREYSIETQVLLSDKKHLDVLSKPDFMIRSSRSDTAFRPIAVFLDGYEYHKDSVAKDSLKRLALVQSGQYRQWSLTWPDVNNWFAKSQTESRNPFTEEQFEDLGDLRESLISKMAIEAFRRVQLLNPLEQLLWLLREPDEEKWQQTGFVSLLGWFNPQDFQHPNLRMRVKRAFPSVLQELLESAPENAMCAAMGQDKQALLSIYCSILPAVFQLDKQALSETFCSIVIDSEGQSQDTFKSAWHGFLRVYNLLQFLPRAGFFSRQGLQQGIYESIRWQAGAPTEVLKPSVLIQDSDIDLTALLEVVDEVLYDSFSRWVERGLSVPMVGFELQHDTGEILAEAELAWEKSKLAGLLEEQMGLSDIFRQYGWGVVELDSEGNWLETMERMMETTDD